MTSLVGEHLLVGEVFDSIAIVLIVVVLATLTKELPPRIPALLPFTTLIKLWCKG